MNPEALIPVRIKSDLTGYIGDEEETLSGRQTGHTIDVVWATVDSVISCPSVFVHHRRKLASVVDESILEYDSYEDEVNSPLGRSPVQIVLEEGPDAYKELRSRLIDNPYLYAAVHNVNVAEAADVLDVTPKLYIDMEDTVKSVGGYRSPPMLAATITDTDGNEYTRDLRTFIPSNDWIRENWRKVGGGGRSSGVTDEVVDEDVQWLNEVKRGMDEPVPETVKTAFNKSKGQITAHFVRKVEDSAVLDEPARLKFYCGHTKRRDRAAILECIPESIDLNKCGNCKGAM